MVLGKLPVPGRPTNLERVGQGPSVLAVGAGRLDIFLSSIISLSFSLSLGDGPIKTEILSQRAVKPKTTNQPIYNSQSFSHQHDSISAEWHTMITRQPGKTCLY